jgi:hypothetical protein
MWQNDLDNFEKKYQSYRLEREKLQLTSNIENTKSLKKKK